MQRKEQRQVLNHHHCPVLSRGTMSDERRKKKKNPFLNSTEVRIDQPSALLSSNHAVALVHINAIDGDVAT